MMRNILLAFIAVLCTTFSWAQQDFHFSQFFAAPVTFNPANSGAFEGDFRAMTNYRSQFGSTGEAFNTIGFSADMPLKVSKSSFDKNFIGVGLYVVNDNAGIIGFNNLHIAGSASYALDLGGTNTNPHYIAFGLQAGYMQRSLDMNAASWERQWSGINFNPAVSSGEQASRTLSEGNINLGAGATWFKSFNEDTRLIAGAALLNANAPKVNLLGDDDNLRRKYVLHASMVITDPKSGIRYLPNVFMLFQGPNRVIDVGGEAEFALADRTQFTDFRNNLSANVGAYYRLQDAIYFIGRLNYHDFSLGISYDFTASQLSDTNNGQGGVELVLGYRTRFSGPGTNRQKLINSKGL